MIGRRRARPTAIGFDEVRTGNGKGLLMQVFDPPWWRVDRWLAWWFSRSRAKGRVTFHVPHDDGVTRAITLRAWEVRK